MARRIRLPRKISLWPVKKLVPYQRNPRLHSDEDVQRLADQIVRRGWTNPILVDEKAGILAGHKRLRAAILLKLRSVPVIVLTHLSEPEKKALLLADNQIAQAGRWDHELLRAEVAALQKAGLSLEDAAFTEDEIKALERHPAFTPSLAPQTQPMEVTEQEVQETREDMRDRVWRDQNLKTVTCPHCGEDFQLDQGAGE